MFVWISSGTGQRFGCCAGLIFLLPVAVLTTIGGFGGDSPILLVALGLLVAMFVIPRLLAASAPAEKRKNDEYYDEYAQKPKREEEPAARANDGELADRNDSEDPL